VTHQNQLDLDLFDDAPDVEKLRTKPENQWFDRKSVRIQPRELANAMIGFANADGGRIAVGIHNGEIEGVGSEPLRMNQHLRASLEHTQPPVRHAHVLVPCTNRRGRPDHVLLLDVEASERIHRNQAHECYLRIGDVTKKLTAAQERELAFDKHEQIFDRSIVPDLTKDDLDLTAVQDYAQQVMATSMVTLLRTRHLYFDRPPHRQGVTQAGYLLFGLEPPVWSYTRYLRYTGTTIETGERSNIEEDIRLDGTIPSLITQAKAILDDKLRVTRLTTSGRFERVLVLPEFAWLEAIVNAVTHRSYSLQGDGIRIRDFADRLEVENPGRLPGLVRIQNIRETRLSRNPHIARVMVELTGYVRELNEGVQRMFEEMERYGLRDPVYSVGEANVRVTLYKQPDSDRRQETESADRALANFQRLESRIGRARVQALIRQLLDRRQVSNREAASVLGVTPPTARRYLRLLEEIGLVELRAKSQTDPTAKWHILENRMWASVMAHVEAT
jgi:ATP-dependent DNA helicase RecG